MTAIWLSWSEFLFRVQPVWRCVAFHVRRGRGPKMAIHSVGGLSRREILKISAALAGSGVFDSAGAAQPGGQLTWGVHVSLAPTWYDPAETPGNRSRALGWRPSCAARVDGR